ncbi:ABC transporter substrate-binding protein [Paenibacillus taiwanensis]|uniref:ABC transporter substrate-binding protein n=1 Tax=Paenibacillus taiwanensis TaxID=401638 RepID=UPI0004207E36|nr:ABC transporter substrate-binding protein [Paenibacillus taiwanensis]
MKFSRQFGLVVLLAVLTVVSACGAKGTEPAPAGTGGTEGKSGEKIKIGITQIVEHLSLDEARRGFVQALKDAGYVEGETLEIDFQNAQGDLSNAATISQKFASDNKDLVLAIATPTAQAAVQNIKNKPILFTAVTDPIGAGLVQSIEKPGANVTGTADLHPEAISKLMEFIANHITNIKSVGILANEGEQNTQTNVKQAVDALSKLGLQVVKAPVANSSEVKQATESLVGKVQAIYVPSDNTVVSALATVISVATDNKIPTFVADKDSVKNGGVASYGFEYFDLGYSTGKMAVEILKDGKKPADLAVKYPEKLDLVLNMKAAASQGFDVTAAIKAEVKQENLFE